MTTHKTTPESVIITVPFHGETLVTVGVDSKCYVAMKPIVEGIGLDWGTQYRKLMAQAKKFSICHMTMPGADGKHYEMLCIPLEKLNGWLFSVNPAKVKPDLHHKITQYQEGCFQVLYEYWMKYQVPHHTVNFPVALSLKERVVLIELKRKLSLSLAKASTETHPILRKSLYEVCARLGEVSLVRSFNEELVWDRDTSLPDGSVPF